MPKVQNAPATSSDLVEPGLAHLALLFLMFLVSGFCGLLYQVIWMRLAFAAFGVITPVMSVVISVFMAGLGFGSWGGGRWIGGWVRRSGLPAVFFYGLAEVMIGVGGLMVPALFAAGESRLLRFGSMESLPYLAASAAVLALSILPWCAFMGTTFPFMMAHIRQTAGPQKTSFSFLYVANVIGAMLGTALTAMVLIEWLGFRHCLTLAAACNFAIALAAFVLAARVRNAGALPEPKAEAAAAVEAEATAGAGAFVMPILFMTGFTSMAMEVVWTRAFTPVLLTTIYAFAALLATYLCATWIGAVLYRTGAARGRAMDLPALMGLLSVASILPLLINDPRFGAPFGSVAYNLAYDSYHYLPPGCIAAALASIVPFCLVLGYLSPQLIDRYSGGRPDAAGYAYAVNVVGCILGPLVAGYLLLPWLGVKWSLIVLSVPYLGYAAAVWRRAAGSVRPAFCYGVPAAALLIAGALFARTYEDGVFYGPCEIRRDYVGTTIAYGSGFEKKLRVNGVGMTALNTTTKMMAHAPLAALNRAHARVLVICFGMGTTYRSALTWPGTDVTAIELVPGVRDVFGFFHADAAEYADHPRGRIVVDDGRRYLRRVSGIYDLITIDPPPPLDAAGTSLLYSPEFYRIAKQHLATNGILMQWCPGGEKRIIQAATRSLTEEFPHVRAFRSVQNWGFHLIASPAPLDLPDARRLAAVLPDAARRDLRELPPYREAEDYFAGLLGREIPLANMLHADPAVRITDDRPFNEYYLLRRHREKAQRTYRVAF